MKKAEGQRESEMRTKSLDRKERMIENNGVTDNNPPNISFLLMVG